MFFGISDADLLDKNKIKIISGIAGSGKSQSAVDNLRRLGVNFCLASFSNALKFAAADRFKCDTDTICGLEFINHPYPRSAEREVTEFDTVVNDEILLDGIECLNWMKHNVSKVNIIALTDNRQMLQAENSKAVIKVFDKLCKQKNVIYVETTKTYRAKNDETRAMYDELYNLNSDQLFTVNQAVNLFKCDVLKIEDISYDKCNTYICHSNRIEHEIYKRYDLSNNRLNDLIPKNHIARNRKVDFSKYPICDQISATDKKINAYLQVANCASVTRFQGREVDINNQLYFLVENDSLFTGRELYTVGTRAKDMKSIHIVIVEVTDYKDPVAIKKIKTVNAKRLDIPDSKESYSRLNNMDMNKLIKEHGEPGAYYYKDIVSSGERVIYGTMSEDSLKRFCDIVNEKGEFRISYKKTKCGAVKSIRSICKKDVTMHFDYIPKVYSIINDDVTPPRIVNPKQCKKDDFDKLCDIYSAFPTVLKNADMPSAGFIYEERSDDLLNFYVYEGDIVTKGSVITEKLAEKLGDSRYVFSVPKQKGCELGRYTYEQCRKSKEKKDAVNKNFLWGMLESDYYKKEIVCCDGQMQMKYVIHREHNLELIACALWSELCCVMLDAIESIGADKFVVVTDGLYYNGDREPKLPEWCDYRIEDKKAERIIGKDKTKKYDHIIKKSYEDLKTDKEIERQRSKERQQKRRANMTEEQKAAQRARDAERKRKARAKTE